MNQLFQKRNWVLIYIILHTYSASISSENPFYSGAREAAMANSILTLGGTWTTFHNPAGLALNKNPAVGFNYQNNYLISELSNRSFVGILPYKEGAFGTSYSYYGSSRFNQQKTAIGYAHQLSEKIDAGILIDLYSSNLPEDYETDYAIVGEVGVIVRPADRLSIGLHVNNITNSSYNKYIQQQPNSWFRSGLSWTDKNFMIGAQLTLLKEYNPVFSIGTEINLVKNFDIRAGVSNKENSRITLGMGYTQKRWRGDVAFSRHPVLGISSFLSFEIFFGKIEP